MTPEQILAWLDANKAAGREPANCNQLALRIGVGRSAMSLALSGLRTCGPLMAKVQKLHDALVLDEFYQGQAGKASSLTRN
jgi:hypothetical protein